jgi:hypothetical protein
VEKALEAGRCHLLSQSLLILCNVQLINPML